MAFLAYFLILLTVGLVSHKRQTSAADFIMGNRSLSFWLTALTAHASDMSSWLFMAFPAALFMGGFPFIWIALGLILGMYCNWQFVAEKLRVETEKHNSYTLSTFFERRFQDTSGIIRLLTSLICVFFLTIYISGAGLQAMGILFESLFGINYYTGLSIATAVVVTYTFVGGFITVAWTDFFQGIFLLAVIILVPVVAWMHIDGWNAIEAGAQANGVSLHLINPPIVTNFISILTMSIGWGLGYFGQPHIVTKFMGIKTPSEIRKSKWLGMSWQTLALGAAATLGIIGIGFFPDGLDSPQLVFVEMVKILFHPFLAGFILCAVIAANMSTMDSQILVCASTISEDLYKKLIKRNATSLQLLRVSQYAVVFVSLLSLGIAFARTSTIMEIVEYAWSGLGASFGPLTLTALYSTKANRYGAMAGILVGSITSAIWPFLNPQLITITINPLIPGFSLSLLAIWLVSRLTKNWDQKTNPVAERKQ